MDKLKRFRQKKFSEWIAKRVPRQAFHELNKHNIFILPSGAGTAFLFCWIAIYLLATNYQNNVMLLFSYWLLAIFLLVMLLSFLNLHGLVVASGVGVQTTPMHLNTNHVVFLGQAAHLKLSTQTNKDRFDLTWHDHNQLYSTQISASNHYNQLSWYPEKRGVFDFPLFKLESTAPLGWFKVWTYLHFNDRVWVCPTPMACPQYLHGTKNYKNKSPDIFSDEFSHLSGYKAGDLPSRIVWKKLLPQRPLQVKRFAGEQSELIQYTLGELPGDLEQKLACITWLVMQAHQHSWLYQVTLPNKVLLANRTEQQYLQILQAISLVGQNNG